MAVAILALALVACGGETATTTDGGNNGAATTTPAVTTPKNEAPATNPTSDNGTITTAAPTTAAPTTGTLPATTSKAPETTTPPETLPPVEALINELMDTAWWDTISRKSITYTHNDDGTTGYVWSLSMANAQQYLPVLPEDHPDYPSQPTLQHTTAEGARVFIKDMTKDTDYTEYKVTNWKTSRWCDIWFEAEGFVPTPEAQYDVYLFFVSPELATNPGEYIYVWPLEDPWTYNPPTLTGNAEVDAIIDTAYQVQAHRHSQRWDISYPTDANAYDFDPATFPTMNFNWTYASDNTFPHLDGGEKAWQYINKENGYAYIRLQGSTEEFVRYDIDYMLLARHCDMWFTLKDFTPVENQAYEMVVFFTSGYGAAHEYALHYVYVDGWIAGPHE